MAIFNSYVSHYQSTIHKPSAERFLHQIHWVHENKRLLAEMVPAQVSSVGWCCLFL